MWLLLYGSYALSRPPLPDGPDTVHAEIAREIVTRNDWVTTFANGFPVNSPFRALDRSIAVSYRLFGVADWSARLPIALCVLALAGTVFFFARRLFVWNAAGLYAALFVLSLPVTFLATRNLADAPILSVFTALFSLILWHFLIAKRLEFWNAFSVSATACAFVLFTGTWPGILLPLAIVVLIWVVRRMEDPEQQAQWFLIGWTVCAYLFATIFESHAHNGLIGLGVVPPLAMLLGGWLADKEAFSDQKTIRVAYFIFGIGIFVAAVAIFSAIHGPVMFHVRSQLVVVTTPSSRVPLLIGAAALIAGVTGHLFFRLRNRIRIANCFLAGTLGGLIVAIQVGQVIASPRFSSQILADAIRPELEPTDLVVIDGKYSDASSLAFYLERPVLIAGPPVPAIALAAPAALRGRVAIDQVWSGTARVFVWTSADHPVTVPGESFVVARSGDKEILSNQPNSAGAAF